MSLESQIPVLRQCLASAPLFLYTGREWDPDVNLYYYRARWYDPHSSRFLSEDPIYDDYNNPHRYVGNSPTNATDPSGLETEGGTRNRLMNVLNRPIYTPIPRWERGIVSSMPFMGCPEKWDGSPDHPNTTTLAELISEGQLMLLEATLTTLPFAPAAQGVVRTARAASVAERLDEVSQVATTVRTNRIFGHNEYVVKDPAKVAKVKSRLLDFYKKHGGPGIETVDDAILRGRNGALNTETGVIQISKDLCDKYPHLVDGTILEELHHFHQIRSRGWFGRELTKAQHDLLEQAVVQRLLRSGLEIQ